MRVFQIEGDWGIDNLKLSQRTQPQAGAGQVLVSMRASSLNFRDLVVPERDLFSELARWRSGSAAPDPVAWRPHRWDHDRDHVFVRAGSGDGARLFD